MDERAIQPREETAEYGVEARKLRRVLDVLELERSVLSLETRQAELVAQNEELCVAQQELEERRARYSSLYDFSPTAYVTLDHRGNVCEANLTAAALFKVERSRLIGRSLAMAGRIRDGAVLRAHLRLCFEERRSASTQLTIEAGDSPVVVQINTVPVLDLDGRASRCRSTLTDITARKRVEDGLRFLLQLSSLLSSTLEQRVLLQRVAELCPRGIGNCCFVHTVEHDRELGAVTLVAATSSVWGDGREQRFLGRVERDAGIAPVRVLDQRTSQIHPRLDAAGGELDPLRAEHASYLRELGVRSYVCVPLCSKHYRFGTITFGSTDRRLDRQDLETAEQVGRRTTVALENAARYHEAARAAQTREEILATVSHELRAPLASMTLRVQKLLRSSKHENNPELESISRAVTSMTRMVSDLLDLTSIDAGALAIRPAECWPLSLLSEIHETLASRAESAGVQLTMTAGPEVPRIICDHDRILQVLHNLVGNAIKFTPSGGSIQLSLHTTEEAVIFTVRDTGPGIPPETLERLFARYCTSMSSVQGTGLGLSIARGIVEAHGGRIWAENLPGGGAAFHFLLPRVTDGPEQVRRTTPPPGRPLLS